MATPRQRWRLRALMGLIALAGLGMALLREWPELGPVYRLKLGDPQARMAAAVQLGMRAPTKGNLAGPALEAALSDPEQGVCDCAAWALDQSGSTSPALVRALARQVEVETALALRWRWQGDFYRRVEPDQALKRIKPTAATLGPLLGTALASPDPWVRLRAATLLRDAIGWSGGPTPDISPLLLATLGDEDSRLRFVFIDDLTKSDAATRRAAVAFFLQRLRSPNPPNALEATVALARFGPEAVPAVEILADRLQKGDLTDRLGTLFLLGKLGPVAKPAVPAILQAMRASDAGANKPRFLDQFWGTAPVGINGDRGIPPDPEGWSSHFDSLREYGVLVLGRIDREAERQGIGIYIEMLGADAVETRRTALETLAKLRSKASSAIPALINLAEGMEAAPAQSDDSNLTYLIFKTIPQIGTGDDPQLVAALVRMLKSKVDDQRARAMNALGDLSPPPTGVVPALVVTMKDPYPAVRRSACDALGRYHGPEGETALPVLLAAMSDPDLWVRTWAGRSLAGHGEAAAGAIPPLIRLLRAENRNLRSSVAEVIGKFGPPARMAAAALLVALDDGDDHVRKLAEDALNAVSPIEPRPTDGVLEALRRGDIPHRRAAACDLVRPGSAAAREIPPPARVEALRVALGDPAPDVRATAAAALGRMGRPAEGAAPALLAALRDDMPEVRILAATALGRIAPGDAGAVEALGQALAGDPDGDVRGAAAAGLGRMGPPAATAAPRLIRALDDRDATVRVQVIVALGRIGPADGSVAPALQAIAERDPAVDFRVWAIRALGLVGGKSAVTIPTLLNLLDDADGYVRGAAAWELGEIRPAREVLPELLGRLNDGKPAARALAAEALGMLGPEVAAEAVPALIRALRDEDDAVRQRAVHSLSRFKTAAAPAEPALRRALNDSCPAVRRDAETALGSVTGRVKIHFSRSSGW